MPPEESGTCSTAIPAKSSREMPGKRARAATIAERSAQKEPPGQGEGWGQLTLTLTLTLALALALALTLTLGSTRRTARTVRI